MTTPHMVPQEIIAHLRRRFTEQGIDAKPVFVIGPDREDGQIEFFTGDGMVWPVVMRVGRDGMTPVTRHGEDTAESAAAASLTDAADRILALLSTCGPQPLREPGLALEA